MPQCEAKRGFFVLYDCTKEAAVQCSGCKRHLCNEHHLPGDPRCLECEAKRKESDHEMVEVYRERHQMHRNENQRTIHLGSGLGDYYDRYDIHSFNLALASVADLSDAPDESFFDS